jgi:hypothetical protein
MWRDVAGVFPSRDPGHTIIQPYRSWHFFHPRSLADFSTALTMFSNVGGSMSRRFFWSFWISNRFIFGAV